jgi:hypothetical protein
MAAVGGNDLGWCRNESVLFGHGAPPTTKRLLSPGTKKADVAEHPEVFDHVGLLFNEPPGRAELLFI